LEIGTKIREILNTLEMKQSELSFKTGIDPGHLSKIVNNKVKPDTDTLERIAEALQVNNSVYLLAGCDLSRQKTVQGMATDQKSNRQGEQTTGQRGKAEKSAHQPSQSCVSR